MKHKFKLIKIIYLCIIFSNIFTLYPFASTGDIFKNNYTYYSIKQVSNISAVVLACPGCRLRSLNDIKEFIRYDLSHYPISYYLDSGHPRINIIDEDGDILLSKYISTMSRFEINKFLNDMGIKKF